MATIVETVKERLKASMKAGTSEKDTLRLLLAKFQTEGAETDDQAIACCRSLINANKAAADKTRKEATDRGTTAPQDFFDKMDAENKILEQFMPSYLDGKAISALLVADEDTVMNIAKAANDGAATGVAMKLLKAKNVPVEGATVKAEVAKIRQAVAALGPILDKPQVMEQIMKYKNENIMESL